MAALLSVGRILPAFAETFPHDGAEALVRRQRRVLGR